VSFRWRAALASAAIAAAAGIVYLPALSAPFVYDDLDYIVHNGFVKDPGNLAELAGYGYFAGTGKPRYRPVSAAGYFAGYALFGLDASGHRLFKVVLHAFNGVLLFFLIGRWSRGAGPAAFAALLFVLHPLAVESVVCIAFNDDIFCLLFLLAALLFALEYLDRGGGARLAVSVCCLLLSCFSKENGLVFFPLLVVLCLASGRRRTRWRAWVLWAAAGAVYALVRFRLFPGPAMETVTPVEPFARIGLGASVALADLRLLFLPLGLSPVYPVGGLYPGLAARPFEVVALVAAAALLLAGVSGNRFRKIGAAWLGITLLPGLHLTALPQALADRYLYIPLAGWGMVMAGLAAAGERNRFGARAVPAAIVLVSLAVLTVSYGRMWVDPLRLWEHAWDRAPASAAAAVNLGMEKLGRGRGPEAEALFQTALDLPAPPRQRAAALTGLADLSHGRGEDARARMLLGAAVRCDPADARAVKRLAWLVLQEGDIVGADRLLAYAVRLNPWDYEAWSLRGASAAERKEWAAAERLMKRALRLNPDFREGRENLALLRRLREERTR